MLNTLTGTEDRITTAHRAKLAYIYVRQSTAGQVRQHQASTELQYRLVDRAVMFGWPRDRIEVIDDDLGKSGTSSDGRDRAGQRRPGAELGCVPPGPEQSGLASAPGAVLALRRAHRRRRTPLRPVHLSRSAPARLVGHHERGGVAPDQAAPSSGRTPEGGAGRVEAAVTCRSCLWS